MDDGVARIIAALAAHNNVGISGQDIDDLSLPFIAPLGSD
jgi:hypothetical protein